MKVATCHSVNLAIEEADFDWQPDGQIRDHLRGCPACQKFYEERVKLRQLVGSVGTVAAPADFDFRLRARLANERPAANRRFGVGGFSLGLPAFAVAAFVLLLGAVLIFRSLSIESGPREMAVTPRADTPAQATKDPVVDEKKNVAVNPTPERPAPVNIPPKTGNRLSLTTATAVNTKRTSTKEAGLSTAPVVKRNEQVAEAGIVFPIDAPESLKLSLDDASGVSRTISLPRVSFGSERVMTGDQFSRVKTSAKGVW